MPPARSGQQQPPRVPARLWLIAATTGSGAFMAMLDSTVVNLALDALRRDLGASLGDTQWVSTGYLIAIAVSLPATAWLSGRFGAGRLWSASLALFTFASMLCALAPGLSSLIAARALQGLAAGLMVPAGQAAIAGAADNRQLGRLMGSIGFVVALGPALGPGLGGVLIEVSGWRSLFWINVPFGALALLAAKGLVPAGDTDSARRLDFPGLLLAGLGLPLLLTGAAWIGSGQINQATLLTAIGGALLLAGFLFVSRYAPVPLIALPLLKRARFAAATATVGFTGAAMYGGLLLLPLYLQQILDRSPGETGMILLIMGLGSAAILPLAGALTDRFGPGPVSLTGGGFLLLGTLPFLLSPVFVSGLLVVVFLIRGAGLALAQMPAITAAFGEVEQEEKGDAATLLNIAQRLGGSLGAIAVMTALEDTNESGRVDAYTGAFVLLSAISFMALLSAAILSRKIRSKSEHSAVSS